MNRGALVACGLLHWVALAAPGVAAGAEGARLGLTPVSQPGAFFELTLTPGQRHEAELEAANFGSVATDARTYAADAYTIVNGGFGVALSGEAPAATARWISYPTQDLRLGPREAVRVPFVISVPPSAASGEYVAAVVIEATGPIQGGGPLALTQVTRSAIAVAITVPGPRHPALTIGGVTHRTVAGHSVLAYEVDNPGNVHLKPAGTFGLLAADGSPVDAGPVTMGSVYAWGATLVEVPLRQPLAPGDYCARLSLTDAATGAHDETDCLALTVPAAGSGDPGDEGSGHALPETSALGPAAPRAILAIGIALVGGACLLAARRRARRRRAPSASPEAPA